MMALVEWRDDFNVGIDEVDFEHKAMIDLINESYEEAKKDGSSEAVMDSLGEIFEKISAHFALEEKVMKELEYDQFKDHKEDHERLLDSIRDIMDEYAGETVLDDEKFGLSLKEWFVSHFSTKDARLHSFMQH